MNHDCEYNMGTPSAYVPCGKRAVTWLDDGSKFYLCAEHYDVVVAKHPDAETDLFASFKGGTA